MTAPENGTDRLKRPRWRFQFSLRSLFIATTIVAVGCSIFIAAPPWVGVVAALCLIVSTPVVLTTVVIYGRGYARTFCIGGLVPLAFMVSGLIPYALLSYAGSALVDEDSEVTSRVIIAVFLGACYFLVVTNGLLAITTRWLIEARRRRGRQQASPDGQTPPKSDTASVSQTEDL